MLAGNRSKNTWKITRKCLLKWTHYYTIDQYTCRKQAQQYVIKTQTYLLKWTLKWHKFTGNRRKIRYDSLWWLVWDNSRPSLCFAFFHLFLIKTILDINSILLIKVKHTIPYDIRIDDSSNVYQWLKDSISAIPSCNKHTFLQRLLPYLVSCMFIMLLFFLILIAKALNK